MAIANQLRSLSLLTLLSSSLLLAACGGGGSGGGNTSSSKSASSTPASSSSVSSEASSASVSSASSSVEAPTFTLGGSLEGLAGTGLQLANGEESLSLSSNGNFAFTAALHQGDSYTITIAQQPIAPNQTCALTNASGANVTANISSVQVSCTTNTYTVGGSVSGLTATGLVLQNNDGDDLTVNADGNFVFATALADQSAFSVSVKTQPEKHLCSVTGASGILAGANISSVTVSCLNAPAAPTLALAYGPKLFKFTWDAVDGATAYKLYVNADGNSGYTQVGDDLTATSYDEEVTLFNRINAQYTLEACNQAGCNTSAVVNVSEHLEEAIGYVQAEQAEDGDAGGQFSVAISADGNTLVFGAYSDDSNSASDETDNSAIDSGAVYVFQKQNGVWQQQAFLKASTIDAGDAFGFKLALSADGNVLAVGASGEKSNAQGVNGDELDNSINYAGAVYVFARTGGSWVQQAYVKASNAASQGGQEFGQALALSADGLTLAVGARGESSNATGVGGGQTDTSAQYSGAVYVFGVDGDTWVQQAYIKASNAEASDNFGSSLGISADGNRLAVGAIGEASGATGVGGNQTDNSKSSSGAVYVFDRLLGSWSQQAYIKASNPDSIDAFGETLVLSGDGKTLAVGAKDEDSAATGVNGDESDNSADRSGAVYVFALGDSGWSQQAYIKASNTDRSDQFGTALALTYDGSLLAVDARWEDSRAVGLNGDQFDEDYVVGAVYLFKLKQTGWEQLAYVKAPIQNAPEFGTGLAFTPDGSVLAIGAAIPKNNDNNDTNFVGGVYLY